MTVVCRRPLGILSPRQLEVARLLQRGLSVADVAREIWAEPNTVKAHVGRIYAALGISSREELARFTLKHWADPRVCANASCRVDFVPVREGQRFHANRCARTAAARVRRERDAASPERAAAAQIDDLILRTRRFAAAHSRRAS